MKQSYPPFRLPLTMLLSMLLLSMTSFSQVFYVKTTGSDANIGTSWATAFRSIQKALVVAPFGSKVLVAAGTYFPDEGFGATDNVRTSSFTLKNGVELYGGFEPDFGIDDLEDTRIRRSRLSGDLLQNDLLGQNIDDNAFHVVYSEAVGQNTVLDGFLISEGNANGSIYFGYGGGMINKNSSPTLTNCVFSANTAGYGGGMYNYNYSSPTLTNCIFSGNSVFPGSGGGMYNDFSSPTLTNCSFLGNLAYFTYGGGVYNYSSSPKLINCSFSGNAANVGGGVYSEESSFPAFTNCGFSGNLAGWGGGMFNNNSTATLTNCILWGNIRDEGLGGDGNPEIYDNTSAITYSIVRGGYTGTGNLDQDPLFADAANGNLHLQACSPAIDAGSNAAVLASVSTDLDGNNRIIHTTVDMGVFEYSGGNLFTYYKDVDMDGYGDASISKETYCSIPPSGYVNNYSDCDDGNSDVNPGAPEICLNQIDDDCDGEIDEGCGGGDCEIEETYYRDADGDGYGDPGSLYNNQFCIIPGSDYVANNLDCNDNDATITVAAVWVQDADQDDYYVGSSVTTCSQPEGEGWVILVNQLSSDCDDGNAVLNPATLWYEDRDGDGFSSGRTITQCERPMFYYNIFFATEGKLASELSSLTIDCNDSDPNLKPTTWYKDADNDRFSDGTSVESCYRPSGYKSSQELIAPAGDCDDTDAAINPNTRWYPDHDNDGYSTGNYIVQCVQPEGYKLLHQLQSAVGDCNDNDVTLNPNTLWLKDADNDGYTDGTNKRQCLRPTGYKLPSELLNAALDCNDADPVINPATKWYKDADDDGYSDGTIKTQCVQPTDYKLTTALTATIGDCNDNNASINPAVAEVCGNGKDDNCNGQLDETPCYDCQNATGFSTTNITASSARLVWTTTPVNLNPQDWELRYKTTNKGAKWITVGKIPGNKREYDITSLIANQYYLWQIRAKCGKNYTDFSIAIEFKTEGSGIAARLATDMSLQKNNADLLEGLVMYPNPARDHVTLQMKLLATENGIAVIQLLDMNGKLVMTQTAAFVNGLFQKRMPLPSSLSSGIYMVRIIANGKQYHKKLMLKK